MEYYVLNNICIIVQLLLAIMTFLDTIPFTGATDIRDVLDFGSPWIYNMLWSFHISILNHLNAVILRFTSRMLHLLHYALHVSS